MNKTYLKIVFNEIKKSFGRFIAIFAIVALGIGFLAGLMMATPDMHASVDAMYDKSNMADIFIKSATGITDKDISLLSSEDYVKDIMPAYVTDTLMRTSGNDVLATRVYGLPSDISVNKLSLVNGRMPKTKGECLVEQSGGYLPSVPVGSTLTISDENDNYKNIDAIYNVKSYKVVGIVSNPFYFSMERERVSIGSGRLEAVMYIDESCYSLAAYTDLYITVDRASDLIAFTDKYETKVESVVKKIEKPGWYVLDRNANVSYVSFSENSKKVAAIATVFPIFFLLIAALIALTTMTRMVEDERTQIGTLKALGYSKSVIMYKYIAYCGTASFLGSIIGLIAGFALLPGIIWNAYAFSYHLPVFIAQFDIVFAIIATVLAIICTVGATVFACYHELREKPASLMLPRAPKAGKRIFLERINFIWSKLKFSHKATARNLIRNKKHFFLTVIGIAGCTALILTGFGLRDSVGSIANTQFNKILQYNLSIEKKPASDPESIKTFLTDPVKIESFLEISELRVNAANKNEESEKIETSVYVPKDPSKINEYILLNNRISGKAIEFGDNAVVATEKLAIALKIKVGSEFEIKTSDGKASDFVLTGITENYVGSHIYMHPAEYARAFGDINTYDTYLVKSLINSPSEKDTFLKSIISGGNVSNAEFVSQTRKSYDDLLSTMDFVVIVLIIAAGALAIIVLYNLTNININERRKELATLRVLGFHNKEVGAYIFRETLILTIVGTAVGLLLGVLLHFFVITRAESTDLMFGRSLSALSFILSAAFTILFSIIVNLLMYKKLKKIEMVDSMKAID